MVPALPQMDKAAARDAARRAMARHDFLEFVQYTRPDYVVEPVHRYVAAKLQAFLEACERRERPRLMLIMPPQHGKSELSSRRLPAFTLGRNPKWHVGLVSYSADWAGNLGRAARNVVQSEAYRALWPKLAIADDKTAQDDWELSTGSGSGGMLSVGRDGGITGRPVDLLIFDDLIKNRGEAYSDTLRNSIWEGIGTNFMTRQQHGAGVLWVSTQWHHDDPQGRMKASNEGFEVINLEALSPGEGDPLGRPEGEPLAPLLHDMADLNQLRYGGTLSEADWQALYCGQPTAKEGSIFLNEWFERNQEPDPGAPGWVFQSVDTAYSEKRTADYSVIATWRVETNAYRLLHVHRERMAFPSLKERIPELAERWNPSFLLVEDIGSGKSLAQELRATSRLPIVEWKPDRDKVARANAVTSLFQTDRVKLPMQAPWLHDWLAEHLQFPAGAHDDQVDTTTMGLTWAREQAVNLAPTTRQSHEFTYDADMGRERKPYTSAFEDAQAAAYAAVAAVERGELVECDATQYRKVVRIALHVQAGQWIEDGDSVRAMIALDQIRRLDAKHGFSLGAA
jgi:predicted phage terminase large subunit-like protein